MNVLPNLHLLHFVVKSGTFRVVGKAMGGGTLSSASRVRLVVSTITWKQWLTVDFLREMVHVNRYLRRVDNGTTQHIDVSPTELKVMDIIRGIKSNEPNSLQQHSRQGTQVQSCGCS